MRKLKWAALLLLIFVLIAPAASVGALALSGSDPMRLADLSRGDYAFDYVPQANSSYALYVFSADGGEVQARAELLEDGNVIAVGEGRGAILTQWLVAGVNYTVRVSGSGSAIVEIARDALSRCYSQPLSARENEPSQKMIAHAYDAHWYGFQANETGMLMLTCVPQDADLSLSAALFDDSGALIAQFENLSGGACMLRAATEAGRSYRLRVSAPAGGTGYYALNLHRPEARELAGIQFSQNSYSVAAGGEIQLSSQIEGEALLWVSESPETARALPDGRIVGLRPGTARITAYGMLSEASCSVEVAFVALERIEIAGEAIRLSVGDDAAVLVNFTPENASDQRLRYVMENPLVASVSRDGVVKGLQSGETVLTVSNARGTVSASIPVSVSPAVRKYRALLVSEENYPFQENTVRTGSKASMQAIASLLETAEFADASFVARGAEDLSKAELVAEIRSTFRNATPLDVSLIYITCHGSYEGGMSFLELSDGSSISARDLERELRAIPGTVVVLIDSCGSGGAIGAASEYENFAKGITGAFSGAAIRGSKYKVIASAGLDQDSYRIAFNADAGAGIMATAFARALCDGAGWDIDRGDRGTMGADSNYDGSITLDELYRYMRSRVDWYLGVASSLTGQTYRQSVQVWPEGDPFVIFRRESE